jgi:hypothetical protein
LGELLREVASEGAKASGEAPQDMRLGRLLWGSVRSVGVAEQVCPVCDLGVDGEGVCGDVHGVSSRGSDGSRVAV